MADWNHAEERLAQIVQMLEALQRELHARTGAHVELVANSALSTRPDRRGGWLRMKQRPRLAPYVCNTVLDILE